VTINGGMAMRAWYDITAMDINRHVDEAGIKQSAELVTALINQQLEAGFNPEQIVLAGFSQGGAMALHIALTGQHKLAAVIALSCYLPIPQVLNSEQSSHNKSTPFLWPTVNTIRWCLFHWAHRLSSYLAMPGLKWTGMHTQSSMALI